MIRRTSLPGADELFRTTGEDRDVSLPASSDPGAPADRVGPDPGPASSGDTGSSAAGSGVRHTAAPGSRRIGAGQPSGRQRHDEKITVYVSAEELLELEQARLTLRGDHGMVVDRGRIVREALAVVLADLEAAGAGSVLVRRLRGR